MTATNAPSPHNNLSAEQKAHEPSMDDILASIRRIIADDDALPLSRRSRAVAPPVSPEPPRAPEAVETKAPPRIGGDAFMGLGQRLGRNVDVAAPEEIDAPAPVPAQPPMLRLRDFMPPRPGQKPEPLKQAPLAEKAPLADKAPQPDQISQANFVPLASLAPQAKREPQAAAQPAPSAPEAPLALRPSLVEPEKPADVMGASVVSLVQPAAPAGEQRLKIASVSFRAPVFKPPAAAQDAPAEQPAPAERQPQTAAAREIPAPEPVREASDSALLSAASGAKIGASFEALAESLLLRDPQMVERMTREMLRPMLKVWLDDNLPTVVERLVRAEIERVARGRD